MLINKPNSTLRGKIISNNPIIIEFNKDVLEVLENTTLWLIPEICDEIISEVEELVRTERWMYE